MDRRNLFKALGAGVFGYTGVQHAVGSPELSSPDTVALQSASNRMGRYTKYEKLCQDRPEFQDALNASSEEMADRIHKELKLDQHQCLFTKKYSPFSPWRLSLIIGYAAKYGDYFGEIVAAPGEKPIRYIHLGAESVYRIETMKGKLIEFQQSMSGPDYQALVKCPVEDTYKDGHGYAPSQAIRFRPDHVVHIRPRPRSLDEKKLHHCYGVSALYTGKLRMDKYFEEDMTEGIAEIVERFKL